MIYLCVRSDQRASPLRTQSPERLLHHQERSFQSQNHLCQVKHFTMSTLSWHLYFIVRLFMIKSDLKKFCCNVVQNTTEGAVAIQQKHTVEGGESEYK